MKPISIVEEYRRKLQQAAWRLQYHERKRLKHEFVCDSSKKLLYVLQTKTPIEEVGAMEMIRSIPFSKGRAIIYEIFINEKTEMELAEEMHITQQAVSKWKRKALQYLYQTLSS